MQKYQNVKIKTLFVLLSPPITPYLSDQIPNQIPSLCQPHAQAYYLNFKLSVQYVHCCNKH